MPAIDSAISHAVMTICMGELLQMTSRNEYDQSLADYHRKIGRKTATLVSTCCYGGGLIAGLDAESVERLRRYGHSLGMAFQIADDVLDYVATSEEVGKPVGADLRQGTVTLPLMLALNDREVGARLRRILAKIDLNDADFETVVSLVRNSTAIAEAERSAQEFAQEAAAELTRLPRVGRAARPSSASATTSSSAGSDRAACGRPRRRPSQRSEPAHLGTEGERPDRQHQRGKRVSQRLERRRRHRGGDLLVPRLRRDDARARRAPGRPRRAGTPPRARCAPPVLAAQTALSSLRRPMLRGGCDRGAARLRRGGGAAPPRRSRARRPTRATACAGSTRSRSTSARGSAPHASRPAPQGSGGDAPAASPRRRMRLRRSRRRGSAAQPDHDPERRVR